MSAAGSLQTSRPGRNDRPLAFDRRIGRQAHLDLLGPVDQPFDVALGRFDGFGKVRRLAGEIQIHPASAIDPCSNHRPVRRRQRGGNDPPNGHSYRRRGQRHLLASPKCGDGRKGFGESPTNRLEVLCLGAGCTLSNSIGNPVIFISALRNRTDRVDRPKDEIRLVRLILVSVTSSK